MNKSPFDPSKQNVNLTAKITSGLERISGIFRMLLWEHAKVIGISPIQIQILIFVAYHDDTLCNVSQLAMEFNLTKPTISDAVKILDKKGFIRKAYSKNDKRAFTVVIAAPGKRVLKQTEQFAQPLESLIDRISNPEKEQLFQTLQNLILGLNRSGILSEQRTCLLCNFYEKNKNGHYCHFLESSLLDSEIRIDCPEFES